MPPMTLPPPVRQQPAPVRPRWWPGRWPLWAKASGVIAALIVSGFVIDRLDGPEPEDTPSRLRTPVEAACDMLNDGETEQRTYDVMKDLLADESFAVGEDEATAARLAVDRAVAQGCG